MTTKKQMKTLRRVLMRLRSEKQNGFPDVGPDGRYAGHAGFITTGLPQVTPEELDSLMELAGIVPDPIISKGRCRDCVHARLNGTERGYSRPCLSCSRPQMSHFAPITDENPRRNHPDYGNGNCGCKECLRPYVVRRLGG